MDNHTVVAIIVILVLIIVCLSYKNREYLNDHLWSRMPWKNREDFKVMLFYTDTCPACIELKKDAWPRVRARFPNVKFEEINCDNNPDICMRYGVTAYPTILIFRGETSQNYTGGWNFGELAGVIEGKK